MTPRTHTPKHRSLLSMLSASRGCFFYLGRADASLEERAVLQVVGAHVTILAPVTRKHAAHTGSAPANRRRRCHQAGSGANNEEDEDTGERSGRQAYELSTEQL